MSLPFLGLTNFVERRGLSRVCGFSYGSWCELKARPCRSPIGSHFGGTSDASRPRIMIPAATGGGFCQTLTFTVTPEEEALVFP